MRHSVVILCFVVAFSFFAGCGGANIPNREKVYPIAGKVGYKGQPVSGADVTFFCKEKNMSSFGRTDDQGKFQLTTFSANDGAPAGKFMITVSKLDTAAAAQAKDPDVSDPAYDPFKVVAMANLPPPKNAIPVKYATLVTTDLISVVNADGANPEVSLELKD
ncbi:MAG: hypothetical protein IAG10_21925 [Planctomycetaceae bacterium]|nr:hypothetical protein [Planctomycetaceae bacterium]